MIIVRLVSGLGNQLFQYAIAREISLRNNIDLKLDCSFFKGQSLRSYQLNNFNINASFATQHDLAKFKKLRSSLSFKYKILRKMEQFLPKYKRSIFFEDDLWLYDQNLARVNDNTYIDGYWQNQNYLSALHPQVLEELTLKNVGNSEYNHYLSLIKSKNAVSIHIRRGDYLTDAHASSTFGILSLAYYHRAINHFHSRFSDSAFFIFSDDLAWAEEQFKILATFVKIENGQQPSLELDLMSKCNHNIIANSSFSWWGAFLNPNPEKTVIMPKNWVQDENINSKINLKLSNWIQL